MSSSQVVGPGEVEDGVGGVVLQSTPDGHCIEVIMLVTVVVLLLTLL
jgi:hypothetical protein